MSLGYRLVGYFNANEELTGDGANLELPRHPEQAPLMPNPIAPLLERYPVLILDGALATELERRGCDLRDTPLVGQGVAGKPGAD